jgi:hypothetical protein
LVGQFLEALVVSHVGFGLKGLMCRNSFGAFATVQIALQNVIGTPPSGFAVLLLNEELLTEGTATESVDGLDLLKDLLALV